jgi:hypothetical protein
MLQQTIYRGKGKGKQGAIQEKSPSRLLPFRLFMNIDILRSGNQDFPIGRLANFLQPPASQVARATRLKYACSKADPEREA